MAAINLRLIIKFHVCAHQIVKESIRNKFTTVSHLYEFIFDKLDKLSDPNKLIKC